MGSTQDSGPGDAIYGRPVKRSVTIAGHSTAISLEPIFWNGLRGAAAREGLPVNALIARIDLARMAGADASGLAGAIRCWLYDQARRAE